MTIMRLALTAAMCLAAAGCGGGPERAQPPPSAPADGPQTSVVYLNGRPKTTPVSAVTGILGGDPATGCLWLVQPTSKVRIQIQLHGPFTVTWSNSGPHIFENGKLLASSGKQTGFGAGGTTSGVAGCPTGATAQVVF